MTLKTSSFKINKTLFKKTIIRFWPIWAFYFVVLIFMMPVSLFNSAIRYSYRAQEIDLVQWEMNKTIDLLNVVENGLHPVFYGAFAIIVAVAVFSYLYLSRSCYMMHAFPVKRDELFATHYVSGFLILAVPQVIVFLITTVMCVVCKVEGIQYLAMWLLLSLGLIFFFYSMAVFCCMLTGHFLPGFVFFAIFNGVYALVFYLIANIAQHICYGLSNIVNVVGIPGAWLSPIVYLSQDHVLGTEYEIFGDVVAYSPLAGGVVDTRTLEVSVIGALPVGIYCIAAIGLILIALMLYRKRNLECASEITAFPFVKPMIRWMITIVAAIGLALIFTEILFGDSAHFIAIFIIALVVISWVCFFALEMGIHKKFKIFRKKLFLEWIVCAAIMLATVGAMEGDILGLEERQPSIDQIKAIDVSASHQMVLMEEAEIAAMMDIHKTIIENKAIYEAYRNRESMYDGPEYLETGSVRLTYILENGKKFVRRYSIPCDPDYMADETSAAAKIRKLQMDTDSYLKEWLLVNHDAIQMTGGFFYRYSESGESEVIISKEDIGVLYSAMLKDIEEGNVDCYFGTTEVRSEKDFEPEAYYDCYIEIMGVLDEEPIELWQLIDSLYVEQNKNELPIPGGAASEDAYVHQTYEYYSIEPGQYPFSTGFSVTEESVHTIQSLLDLEIIESVEDIKVYYDK